MSTHTNNKIRGEIFLRNKRNFFHKEGYTNLYPGKIFKREWIKTPKYNVKNLRNTLII